MEYIYWATVIKTPFFTFVAGLKQQAMDIITKIRGHFGERHLNRVCVDRRPRASMVGFEQAVKVGVFCRVFSELEYQRLLDTLPSLFCSASRISLLVWNKTGRSLPQVASSLEVTCFTRRDISWRMVPESAAVRLFVEEPFNLLFVPDDPRLFPVRYITLMSRAGFKVGPWADLKDPLFDFMLNHHAQKDRYSFCMQMQNLLTMFTEQ